MAEVSLKDLADVFEIRAALEGLAASLAAERVTDDEVEAMERLLLFKEGETQSIDDIVTTDTDFHAMVYKASRNGKLVQMLENLREQIQRFRSTSLAVPGRPRMRSRSIGLLWKHWPATTPKQRRAWPKGISPRRKASCWRLFNPTEAY